MKAIIDTCFLLAHFLNKNDESKKWTRATLENLQKEPNIGVIPSIAIHEFYKIELQTLGKDIADMRLNTIMKSKLKTANLDPATAIEAAKLRCKYADLGTADAIIAATAIKTGSECILTNDKHITQIKETKTRWATSSKT